MQADWKQEGVPFYRAREIVKLSQYGFVKNDLFITEEHYQSLKAAYGIPLPNDIMLSAVGTIGKTYIVKESDKFYYKDASVLCLQNLYDLYSEYIQIALNSPIVQGQMHGQSKGTTVDTITIEKVGNYILPFPPLAEQKRIVAEIEKWFALIDEIEANKQDLQEYIKQVKSKVLDLAIHGKLVPQDPNDEPAIELLKRINPHFTPCDTSHYENLPASWCVCKVETIADVISGVSYDKSDVQRYGIKILRGGNIQDGKIVEQDDDVYISEKYINESNSIKYGDIILVASTGSQTLIGKTGFAPKAYHHTQIGAFLRIIRAKDSSLCEYLNYVFLSDTFRKHIRELASGTNINNVKNKYITDFILALPPQNEIPRIIKKVNDIFKSLDTITAEL